MNDSERCLIRFVCDGDMRNAQKAVKIILNSISSKKDEQFKENMLRKLESKREFIEFLEKAGVLRFGDFTAKSGRKIPYFINAGDIKTGAQIATLGEFYARAYLDKLGDPGPQQERCG